MKRLLSSILLVVLLLTFNTSVLARSGCCSSHKGVCGCSCCDGTPLSSTCLPYYPECSGGGEEVTNTNINYPTNTPKPLPTWTPKPIRTPTLEPTETLVPTLTPTSKPTPVVKRTTKKLTVKKTVQKKSFWQWLFGR